MGLFPSALFNFAHCLMSQIYWSVQMTPRLDLLRSPLMGTGAAQWLEPDFHRGMSSVSHHVSIACMRRNPICVSEKTAYLCLEEKQTEVRKHCKKLSRSEKNCLEISIFSLDLGQWVKWSSNGIRSDELICKNRILHFIFFFFKPLMTLFLFSIILMKLNLSLFDQDEVTSGKQIWLFKILIYTE